jgi:GTP cyclohydrolase II
MTNAEIERCGPIELPLMSGGHAVPYRLYYYDFGAQGRWAAMATGAIDDGEPVPLRIESACLFGHVFHSGKCDCGFQLDEAFRVIGERRRGIVLYGIDQDARGLGIARHFQIYRLRQQEGLDTDEVYARLDAPVDARSYEPVAAMLRELGVEQVELLSNNRARQQFLRERGFSVQMTPLEAKLDIHNMSTLMLEKEDLGYTWTFKTHRDWLQPIQAEVDGDLHTSIALAVLDNAEVVGRHVDRGEWSIARGLLTGLAPEVVVQGSTRPLVVYLTDLPRADELPLYAAHNVGCVVVPFARIPAALQEHARGSVRLQDWERGNRYARPRPQWVLHERGSHEDVYRREGRIRRVRRERPVAGRDWVEEPVETEAER